MPQSQHSASLLSHVRHLQYAVATTTCRSTVATLRRMLREAEARLRKQDQATERS